MVCRPYLPDVRINCDATPDELIDVIEGNRVYMPCVYALNKIDAITMEVHHGRRGGAGRGGSRAAALSSRAVGRVVRTPVCMQSPVA